MSQLQAAATGQRASPWARMTRLTIPEGVSSVCRRGAEQHVDRGLEGLRSGAGC